MLRQVSEQYRNVRSNRARYPRLNYVIDYFWDLLSILSIVAGTRAFYYFTSWLHKTFPTASPEQLKSYWDLDLIRWIVTVFDAVAIVLIALIGIVTIIKVGRDLFVGLRSSRASISPGVSMPPGGSISP